ncbi:unnamed protein product, partial [marine sediment metagenome]
MRKTYEEFNIFLGNMKDILGLGVVRKDLTSKVIDPITFFDRNKPDFLYQDYLNIYEIEIEFFENIYIYSYIFNTLVRNFNLYNYALILNFKQTKNAKNKRKIVEDYNRNPNKKKYKKFNDSLKFYLNFKHNKLEGEYIVDNKNITTIPNALNIYHSYIRQMLEDNNINHDYFISIFKADLEYGTIIPFNFKFLYKELNKTKIKIPKDPKIVDYSSSVKGAVLFHGKAHNLHTLPDLISGVVDWEYVDIDPNSDPDYILDIYRGNLVGEMGYKKYDYIITQHPPTSKNYDVIKIINSSYVLR